MENKQRKKPFWADTVSIFSLPVEWSQIKSYSTVPLKEINEAESVLPLSAKLLKIPIAICLSQGDWMAPLNYILYGRFHIWRTLCKTSHSLSGTMRMPVHLPSCALLHTLLMQSYPCQCLCGKNQMVLATGQQNQGTELQKMTPL